MKRRKNRGWGKKRTQKQKKNSVWCAKKRISQTTKGIKYKEMWGNTTGGGSTQKTKGSK